MAAGEYETPVSPLKPVEGLSRKELDAEFKADFDEATNIYTRDCKPLVTWLDRSIIAKSDWVVVESYLNKLARELPRLEALQKHMQDILARLTVEEGAVSVSMEENLRAVQANIAGLKAKAAEVKAVHGKN